MASGSIDIRSYELQWKLSARELKLTKQQVTAKIVIGLQTFTKIYLFVCIINERKILIRTIEILCEWKASYRIGRLQTRRLHATLWTSLRHFKFLRNSPLKFATGDQSVGKSQVLLVDRPSKLSFDRGSIWMRGRLCTKPKWTMEESMLQANSSGLVANALIMRWHLNASTVGQRGGSRDRSRSRMLI